MLRLISVVANGRPTTNCYPVPSDNSAVEHIMLTWDDVLAYGPPAWGEYHAVNESFAWAVAHIYKKGDRICIYDHRLLLLPALIRRYHLGAEIAFCLIQGWPADKLQDVSDYLEELMHSLLRANLIVLGSDADADQFALSCKSHPTVEDTEDNLIRLKNGGEVHVRVLPLGVEPESRIPRNRSSKVAPSYEAFLYSPDQWADRLMEQMVLLKPRVPDWDLQLMDPWDMNDEYRRSCERLFLLDYDGTLTPIVANPEEAVPSPELVTALSDLGSDANTELWIISGRPQEFLEEHLGDIEGLGFVAEHGCFVRYPHTTNWVDLTVHLDLSWQPTVWDALETFTVEWPGLHRERKRATMVLHFRNAPPHFTEHDAKGCYLLLSGMLEHRDNVQVVKGKKIIEIRPRTANKGVVAQALVLDDLPGRTIARTDAPALIFCAGDDTTDEDMFQAIPLSRLWDLTLCKVGEEGVAETSACFFALAPQTLITSLASMIERRWA